MPINRKDYPDNWPAIRAAILTRAGHRCEWCGLPDRAWITRTRAGAATVHVDRLAASAHGKPVLVILTVAHLDHDTKNNDPANLRAGCQRCHLVYDRDQHALNAAQTRRLKAGVKDHPRLF